MSKIVVALGGNALGNNPVEQQQMIKEAAITLVDLIEAGHDVIITHGNGPQVGMIHLAFDLGAEQSDKVSTMALMECTAMSQGYIGYHLQKGIKNELNNRHLKRNVLTVITQVVVNKNDPSFKKPTKPIGAFYSQEKIELIAKSTPDFHYIEDSGRGYRQVVASPKPIDIVEKIVINELVNSNQIVIACGGGGIPVIVNNQGYYEGIPAVIDKDFASAKLAEEIGADYLFILTAVDQVAINFGKENQKSLSKMSVEEAIKYSEEGQFGAGSMLPKVQAAVQFASSHPSRQAIIASLQKATAAIKGESGTVIKL